MIDYILIKGLRYRIFIDLQMPLKPDKLDKSRQMYPVLSKLYFYV